jgi:pimeloyl-ACP methyl ester carboxylesterase
MHTGAMAELFAVLMDEVLGYHRFGAQGGDWGSAIVSRLGYRHPDTVIGVHVNLVMLWPYLGPGTPPLSEAEQKYWWQLTEAAMGPSKRLNLSLGPMGLLILRRARPPGLWRSSAPGVTATVTWNAFLLRMSC